MSTVATTSALLAPATVEFVGNLVFHTLLIMGGVVALLIVIGTIVYMLEDKNES